MEGEKGFEWRDEKNNWGQKERLLLYPVEKF
jgi:hypothetical protein